MAYPSALCASRRARSCDGTTRSIDASSIGGRRLGGSIAVPAIGGVCVLGRMHPRRKELGSRQDSAASALADLLLNQVDRVEQTVGRRRTAGNVDVDRNDRIDALNDRVVVEDAARASAGA